MLTPAFFKATHENFSYNNTPKKCKNRIEEVKFTKLNYSLFLKSMSLLSITQSAETARIWPLALGEEALTPVRGGDAPDCTKPSGDHCSLGLLRETGKKQRLDAQHLAALADTEHSGRWKATPARESVLPQGEAASWLFLSSTCGHHSLSKVENSVLSLRQLVSNKLLSVSSPFADTCSSESGGMSTLERRGLHRGIPLHFEH